MVWRGLVAGVGLLFVCVLLCCGYAGATEVHVYRSSFGSAGSGVGQFNAPGAVAVNDATNTLIDPGAGDVYVVDKGNNRVERFNPTGSLSLGSFDGSGSFEVEGKVEPDTPSPTGPFSDPVDIAVDNSGDPEVDPSAGDVYVVDRGHGVIDKFSAMGAYLGQITGTPECTVTHPCKSGGPFEAGESSLRAIKGVAVDVYGTLWVSTRTGPIYSFSNAVENKYVSELETSFGGASEGGLAVDSEDNLYINTGGVFSEVSSSGEILANPFCGVNKAYRAAVDPVGMEVYLDGLESIDACSVDGTPIESDLSGSPFPSFGTGHLTFSKGVAVNASNGTVYASDQTANDVAVFEGIVLPTVVVGAPIERSPREVTLNGTVDPNDKSVTSCVFEYGTTSAYGNSVPCSPAIASSGSSPVPVTAHLSGLTPETKYHYRLAADNEGGSSHTADQEFFTGPILGGESVVGVTSSSATLRDSVDPNGADTHYYYQYGPSSAYGSYAPLEVPGADLGASTGAQNVDVQVPELGSGLIYHYRLVAVQDGEVFAEPDRTFVTQSIGGVSGLSDGRKWELVSPPNKKGALIELFEYGGQDQAASNGSAISYVTQGASAGTGAMGNTQFSQLLSRRGGKGWETANLTLPERLPENGEPSELDFAYRFEYRLFSPDLSLAMVEPQEVGTPLLSSEANERTLYLRNDSTGGFLPLVTSRNVPEGARIEEPNSNFIGVSKPEWEMHFLAATPDLAHVVFKTPMALTPEAVEEESVQKNLENKVANGSVQWNLYEWSGGQLSLVNILPPPGEEVAHGPEEVAHGRLDSGVPPVRLAGMFSAAGLGRGGDPRDVSVDGRRVAWTWGEPYGEPELKSFRGLFVRDMVEHRTVRVGGASATYQTMNSDGSKVFYLENGDLHVFDFDSGVSTDVTSVHGFGEKDAGVQELVSGVSENGSYAYFVAKGDLLNEAEQNELLSHSETIPVGGEDNLYVAHEIEGKWTIGFITTLSPLDKPAWYTETFGVPFLPRISSRVSPDGRYFAFMSELPLTGYDNVDAVSGQRDEEVYLYDAVRQRLVCASCDPTGAAPSGVLDSSNNQLLVDRQNVWTSQESTGGDVHTDHWLAGNIPGWDASLHNPVTYQPRFLSDSGRLFFDSPVGLVPQDTNGLEDVYEFEPEGVGDCNSGVSSGADVFVKEMDGEQVNSCVGLISSGTSGSESAFYDASENGDDAFFTTTGKLVGEDYDKGYDLYDSHVCTGEVPCPQERVVSPPCSSGDSCKAAASPQPEIFGPAPSATFNSNVTSGVKAVVGKSVRSGERRALALKACRKKRGKRRAGCERTVRKRYPLKGGKAVERTRKG